MVVLFVDKLGSWTKLWNVGEFEGLCNELVSRQVVVGSGDLAFP